MKKGICTLVFFLMSQTSQAGNIWCSGTISNLYIDSGKNVIIKGSWRNEYTRICKTDGSFGADTVTCSLWTSLATTSMIHNKSVRLMYNDQNGTVSCDNMPSYSYAPPPSYVMLVK